MELAKEKRIAFFVPFIFSEGNFFNICVLLQCIVYWIHFQNIHTFTYQNTLLHKMLCLFLKSSKTFSVSLSKRVINKLLHTQVCIRRKNLVFALVLLIQLFEQKQPSRVALRKRFLKICSKFAGKHPYWSAILIKLLCYFIEIALRHGRYPVNLLDIFRTPFLGTPLEGCFCLKLKVSPFSLTSENVIFKIRFESL